MPTVSLFTHGMNGVDFRFSYYSVLPLTTCARRPLFPLDLTAPTATLIALPGVSIPNVGCCALCVFCSALAPGVRHAMLRPSLVSPCTSFRHSTRASSCGSSRRRRVRVVRPRNSFVTNSRGHACHGCRVGVVVVVLDNICEELFRSVVQVIS